MLLSFSPAKNDNYDPLIENLKKYIEENLEYKIDLTHIAAIYHYNEKYLGRLFKRKMGKSLCEYVTERRLEMAKDLLLNTDYTVLSISEKSGFQNVTYFNRMFKVFLAYTPTEFRKKFKKIK